MDLDNNDKIILSELYQNGRNQISVLSKRTKIQRDSIKYRIKRFLKKEIIRNISPRLNYTNLGYPLIYRIDINIISSNLEKEEKFYGFLSEFANVIYIEKITGKWDLSIIVVAKTNHEFDDILKNIRKKYGEIIKDYEISTISKIIKWWDYRGLLK
jgi:DNA-binding Lrp family transcriptional regulator